MMMFHRRKLPFLSGLSTLLLICTLLGMQVVRSPNAYADYTVTVTPGLQYQTIQGWGTSLAWWANVIGGWSDSKRVPLADALYSPTSGIGLNILRYNFGADGPTNVCHNQMLPGRNVPSFEPTQGNYVWTNDANQLWFAKAAQARGANVFEGFVNSAPAWMLNNSCTAGGANGAENLNPAYYSAFASYMATIAKHFHDNFGITLQTVEPFNEPSSNWWKSTGTQEGMGVSAASQNTIIPLVASALSANGASAYTSVAAQDDNSIRQAYNDYESYSSSTKADITQWNTHAYSGSDGNRANAYAYIGQTDHKTLWMSEWGTGDQGSPIRAAMTLSKQILDDEQHLHPSAWVSWQAAPPSLGGDPSDLWVLVNIDSSGNLSYPSRYYALGNYSKFVRPGYQMIGNSDANSFTTYNASTHSLVIVTTNSTTSSEVVNYDLSAFNNAGMSATPYQTSASENLQQLASVDITNKTFTSTLPAQSITTFVIPHVTYNPTYSTIVNRNSGLTIGASGASTTPGASIIQQADHGGTDQRWDLVPLGNGYYTIVNRNSGMVLDVSGASTSAGANVIQWPSNGGTNQQWSLKSVSGGYYELVNRHSGMVLDVNGASTSAGASMIQSSSTGGTDQQWRLLP